MLGKYQARGSRPEGLHDFGSKRRHAMIIIEIKHIRRRELMRANDEIRNYARRSMPISLKTSEAEAFRLPHRQLYAFTVKVSININRPCDKMYERCLISLSINQHIARLMALSGACISSSG